MMDLIDRQAAINEVARWKGYIDDDMILRMQTGLNRLPSVNPQEPCEDAISRKAAIDQTYIFSKDEFLRVTNPFYYLRKKIKALPAVQPEHNRMTNKEWIDFLSKQFDISRTSAREMLHGMMQCKKEDNFKKMFNPRGEQDG